MALKWLFFLKKTHKNPPDPRLWHAWIKPVCSAYQRWSPCGRTWPRERPRVHILKSLALAAKVKALALASKPQVLEAKDLLEDTFWSLWLWPRRSSPWPWSFKSSKIALSSARGQHCFLYHWNLARKRQKRCGKFAKTFFCFAQLEIAWKIFYCHY